MGKEIEDKVRKAIAEVGTDVRTFVVKTTDTIAGVTEEALHGSPNVGDRLQEIAAEITSSAIGAVEKTGIDDSTVVVNSIEGTIRGARRLGHSGKKVVEQSVKGSLGGILETKGDITQATRSSMVGAIIGTRDMALAAEDAAAAASSGAIVALRKTKRDIGQISKDTISGAVGGVARSNGQLAGVISSVTQYNISTAMVIGADPVVAARESIAAAIEIARELGISAEEMAGAAATGVIEAARKESGTTARHLLTVIDSTISGVRVMGSEPPDAPRQRPPLG